MALARDYSGQTYGRLTAVRRVDGPRNSWLFTCSCGGETITQIARVRFGMTQSCGCIAKERLKKRSVTHGHAVNRTVSPTLSSYRSAYARCYQPSAARYAQYGGRGIVMCERWKEDFQNFLDDMGPRPDGMTLDRIDPHGNYEPSNCRWASPLDQAGNQIATIRVQHEGETYSLRRFASIMSVPYKSLYKRVVLNGQEPMSAALEMMQPLPVLHEGRRLSVKEYAAAVGVNYKSLHRKMHRENISPEVAAAALIKHAAKRR